MLASRVPWVVYTATKTTISPSHVAIVFHCAFAGSFAITCW